MAKHGVSDEHIVMRVTGCPNGCGRAMLAEVGLVGKAPGRYNLHLGGNRIGTRIPRMYKENITEPEILASLDELIGRWAKEREAGEGFDATLRCVRASFARCSIRRAICGINHQPGLVGLIRRVSVASGKANSEESMSKLDLNALNELPKVDRILALAETNAELEKLDAEGRVAWALDNLPVNMYFLPALAFRRR